MQKFLYRVHWVETFYGDPCEYPRTTIFDNKEDAEAFVSPNDEYGYGSDEHIEVIDVSWWTPATKVIKSHVHTEPEVDGKRIVRRHDFDNGLSLIYERFLLLVGLKAMNIMKTMV